MTFSSDLIADSNGSVVICCTVNRALDVVHDSMGQDLGMASTGGMSACYVPSCEAAEAGGVSLKK
jgi:hypothetical protein